MDIDANGSQFGTIRLSRLTLQDIEYLYAATRAAGKSPTCDGAQPCSPEPSTSPASTA